MKKLLSLLLALTLTGALAVPAAAAEESVDDRLAAVTARVKETLDLDTEDYTDFYGEPEDNPLASAWSLEWYGEGKSLSVTAVEPGKVLSYYRYDEDQTSSSDRLTLSFPAGDRDSAKAAALAFVDRVLDENETAVWNESGSTSVSLRTTRYRFSGEILVNGLSADLTFSVSVSCQDAQVLSFYRDSLEGSILEELPAPDAAVTAQQAAAALRDTLALRLEYVLPAGEDTHAILRYLPESGDDYYVDAATGELVDLTDLFRQTAGNGNMTTGSTDSATSEEASAADSGLSSAEQAGIAKLEGVLDRDTLDAKVRAVTALGLDGYTLASVSYSVDRDSAESETPAVTAALRYGKQVGSATWQRTAVVDARTGQLRSVYSSARQTEDAPALTVDAAAAQQAAEDFLAALVPEQFAKTALYRSSDAQDSQWSVSHSFTFAQQENGYFYTGNAFYIGVDATDGSISSYSGYFDDAVTFEDPDGILSMDAAIDAWLATYQVSLRYVLTPAAIDLSLPEYPALSALGLSYLYRPVVGYQLERDTYLYGIDAKTGQSAAPNWETETDLTYDDLTGHWVQEKVEALAQYGVGYAGGAFLPGKTLTQLDLIALLVSTQGYRCQLDDGDSVDDLYQRAYSAGLLKRADRDDAAVLTRAQTVQMILDAAGYSGVAKLEGIFRTSFTDDAEIPAAFYGYAALAQGLGVVGGVPGQAFRPTAPCTRAEAAAMLYNLMSR
jgi:hypothetical protein